MKDEKKKVFKCVVCETLLADRFWVVMVAENVSVDEYNDSMDINKKLVLCKYCCMNLNFRALRMVGGE